MTVDKNIKFEVNGCKTAVFKEVFHINRTFKNNTVHIFTDNQVHVDNFQM